MRITEYRTRDNHRPASERQISFIQALLTQHEIAPEAADRLRGRIEAHDLDVPTASATIDWLKRQPVVAPAAATPAKDTEHEHAERIDSDGMYSMDGVVYKVQRAVHGSGQLYAKRLVIRRDCEGHESLDGPIGNVEYCDGSCRPASEAEAEFVYAPGIVTQLRPEHRLSLEQAKAFGRLYGICVRCGATLTDETSIAAGIGPVCAGRF